MVKKYETENKRICRVMSKSPLDSNCLAEYVFYKITVTSNNVTK